MKKNFLFAGLLTLLFASQLFAQTRVEKLFYLGQYAGALELIERKADKQQVDVADLAMAARCAVQLFQFEKARDYYEQALGMNADDVFLKEGLADAFLNLGQKEKAAVLYGQIIQTDSTNVHVAGKMAALLLDLDQFQKAAEIYGELHQHDRLNSYFFRKYMFSLYKQKKYDEVIALYQKQNGVEEDSTGGKDSVFSNLSAIQSEHYFDREVEMMLADSYLKLGNNIDAIETLYGIVDCDSVYVPALNKLAYIQFSAYRNYTEAVKLYRVVNRLEAYSDPFHLKNWGICEYFTGNCELAAPLLDSLIGELNNDPFVVFYAGLSYKKCGFPDRSLELLEQAATLVIPAYTGDLYHHLGRAYSSMRRFEEALETYNKVREYDKQNYQVLYDIAVTHEEFNLNRAAALVFYEQFAAQCTNERSTELKYARQRIEIIREELFFEGN
ncbi:tetratricopeptide repeat protein [Roseimarinus sediminis]|uniref:tetratricopeptide repeat protein n=1 Tax=Roseimarinus sediminis TaxID=1610899 RepID=UPI003D19ADF9